VLCADRDGEGVWVEGRLASSDDIVELARDIAVLKMRRRNVSWRRIGRFFNTPVTTLRDRLERIPPDVREYYLRTPLDTLGL
jgi:hypothetical protein